MDSLLDKYRAQWIQLVEARRVHYSEENLGYQQYETQNGNLIKRIEFTVEKRDG
jgi:uncharacterized protein YaiL (DUF2058 family)